MANNIVEGQAPPTSVTNTLATGWRKVCTADGKIYYQNDITKQTQWEAPIAAPPIIEMQQNISQPSDHTANTSDINTQPSSPNIEHGHEEDEEDQEDEYQDADQRKWWYKEHIICAAVFILNIYDYITDLRVAATWFNVYNICPQFNCPIIYPYPEFEICGYILIVCASVGFIANFIKGIFEGKILYIAYKYPMSLADEIEKELRRDRRALLWSWIPLMLEDIVSLFLIFLVYANGARTVYIQSMAISCCSIIVALSLLSRKRGKLKSTEEHQQNKIYTNVLCCHCVWCTLSALITGLLAYALWMDFMMNGLSPVVDIADPQNVGGDPDNNGTCFFTDPRDIYWGTVYTGDIIETPILIHDNCYGIDYDYNVECRADEKSRRSVKVLHCDLEWFNNDDSYCKLRDNNINCTFDLNIGICEYHKINCDNFDFVQGNPMMWACFDYCYQ